MPSTIIHFNRTRCFQFASIIVLVAACAGCRSNSSPVAVVRGKIQLDDKPLANGFVITVPSAGRGAKGVIRNGEFELGTFSTSDGAVIGTHKVAVTATEAPQGAGPEAAAGKLLVPERYTNPDASELTIDVKAGEVNAPTLKLTSP